MEHRFGIDGGQSRGQAGAQAGQNQALAKAITPSCFGNIEDVCAHARRTALEVESMVDRLVGSEPRAADTAAEDPMPDGLFDAADRDARNIRASLQRIENAMARLEKSLP